MKHPTMHSWAHTLTPQWMPKSKALEPHIDEPSKFSSLIMRIRAETSLLIQLIYKIEVFIVEYCSK